MRHPPLTALAAVASLLLAAAAASPAAARSHAAPHASATISSWDSPAFTPALETLGEGDADQPIAQPSLDGLADPGPAEPTSSRTVATLAVKIVDSGDNQGLPFIIVDKPSARVLVFDAKATDALRRADAANAAAQAAAADAQRANERIDQLSTRIDTLGAQRRPRG